MSQSVIARTFENSRDVARVVLAVAIHANHIIEAQFVGQPVAGLHAAAQAQVIGQAQHASAGALRQVRSIVDGCVVHHQNPGVRARNVRTSRTTPAMAPASLKAGISTMKFWLAAARFTVRPPGAVRWSIGEPAGGIVRK